MNYYVNQNSFDYPYNINDDYSSKNNYQNNEKYKDELFNNQKALNMHLSKEETNSKDDILEINNEEETDNLGTGRFRLINTQEEKEKKIKENNENNNDEDNFSTNKTDNNNSNKITNNICIIINKPELNDLNDDNKNNDEYSNNEEEENKTYNNFNEKELNMKLRFFK